MSDPETFFFSLRLFSFCLKIFCLLLEIPVARRGPGEVSPQLCRPLLSLCWNPSLALLVPHLSLLCSVCPTCTLTLPQDWWWEVGVGGGLGHSWIRILQGWPVAEPSPDSAESLYLSLQPRFQVRSLSLACLISAFLTWHRNAIFGSTF